MKNQKTRKRKILDCLTPRKGKKFGKILKNPTPIPSVAIYAME